MLERLANILIEVAAEDIVPNRPGLHETRDFVEPWQGEIVTDVDGRAERAVARRLKDLKDLPTVGEEGARANPRLLELVKRPESFWLLDPLDGTAAFASGRDEFGIMCCLVERGQVVLSAIHCPIAETTIIAELGSGAYEDGRRIARRVAEPSRLAGTMYEGFFDGETRARLLEAERSLDATRARKLYAASFEYPAVARGDKDFVVYGRLRPWDHAPGSLIVSEAGGVVGLASGESPYHVALEFGPLVAAGGPSVWRKVAGPVAEATLSPRAAER